MGNVASSECAIWAIYPTQLNWGCDNLSDASLKVFIKDIHQGVMSKHRIHKMNYKQWQDTVGWHLSPTCKRGVFFCCICLFLSSFPCLAHGHKDREGDKEFNCIIHFGAACSLLINLSIKLWILLLVNFMLWLMLCWHAIYFLLYLQRNCLWGTVQPCKQNTVKHI